MRHVMPPRFSVNQRGKAGGFVTTCAQRNGLNSGTSLGRLVMCPVMCADRGPTRLYKAERQESFRAKNPNRLPLVDRSPPAAQSLITSEKIKTRRGQGGTPRGQC